MMPSGGVQQRIPDYFANEQKQAGEYLRSKMLPNEQMFSGAMMYECINTRIGCRNHLSHRDAAQIILDAGGVERYALCTTEGATAEIFCRGVRR